MCQSSYEKRFQKTQVYNMFCNLNIKTGERGEQDYQITSADDKKMKKEMKIPVYRSIPYRMRYSGDRYLMVALSVKLGVAA